MTIARRPRAAFAWLLAPVVAGAPQAEPLASPPSAALSPAAERIRADLAWLSSPEPTGRRAGSPSGADRVADAIAERFRRLGLLPAGPKGRYLESFGVLADAPPGPKSVLGMLPGADPKRNPEIVIVAAPYDGRGGEDGASGTAALLEMARDFAERKPPLPRSLLFIVLGDEEIGTLASLPFTKDPATPQDPVVAVVVTGRLGRLRGDRLGVRGAATSPAWRALLDSANAEARLRLSLRDGGFGPSGGSPAHAAKRPVLFVSADTPADDREPAHTAGKVDVAGIVRVATFLERIVASVASAPGRIAFSPVTGEAPGGPGPRPDPVKSPDSASDAAEVDERDPDLLGVVVDPLLAVELAEVDRHEAGVRDQLEAIPAGGGRRVDLAPFDPDAVQRRLENRVRLGVDRGRAVAVLHEAADLVAVRQAPERAVVAGRENPLVPDDDRADVLARTGGALRHLAGDVHEVPVPVDAVRHGRGLCRDARQRPPCGVTICWAIMGPIDPPPRSMANPADIRRSRVIGTPSA
jgi:hypothetical protein